MVKLPFRVSLLFLTRGSSEDIFVFWALGRAFATRFLLAFQDKQKSSNKGSIPSAIGRLTSRLNRTFKICSIKNTYCLTLIVSIENN